MKIYILTDLEGPAGVNRFDQTRTRDWNAKAHAARALTGEINAAVEGILSVSPKAEVWMWDAHGSGGVNYFDLHPELLAIMHGPVKDRAMGLDSSFDGLFFVGQHAMAGTPDAPLAHTYSSRNVTHYKLNGQFIGEFGGRATMAGTCFGVPAVFLSGDDKACAEAKALVPNIVTVETKKGWGLELALHLSHSKSCDLIRKGAARAVKSVQKIKPVVLKPPYELEIRVNKPELLAGYRSRKGAEIIDHRTVVIRTENLLELPI